MSADGKFYSRPEFRIALKTYQVQTGDLFFNDRSVTSKAWADALKSPIKAIRITLGSRGEFGPLWYVIETWDGSAWSTSEEIKTNQAEFQRILVQ